MGVQRRESCHISVLSNVGELCTQAGDRGNVRDAKDLSTYQHQAPLKCVQMGTNAGEITFQSS